MTCGLPPFTARQNQILGALGRGLSCRSIARELSISEFTVRKHRSNMLTRLCLRNVAELVTHARRQGWLMPPTLLEKRLLPIGT
ncbi:LuxR C-terminal-related transcriptional regulator [Paraburkholderia sp. CNPSo 3274]|uniref:response regulator transcription factor n=1 Tax=Paraburkholderia TaxID=1822464 RepID=UPI001FE3D104|nr:MULTISPECIES: LuxR C-terminal-related transcriptional regulator [Paraburkholderia]MCP3712383.1 LuxR C-terminal-related transcriptional regulator [Paraburkholderia sp. CNPSo 3274]MCP3721049.1 LuxR C-terminal-related transcriptional regulator [Paraburkholderia sp. CNPSo 3281]MCX5544917.1 LuxR C-terminal-related transcriptional regulator [Paraburkholderia sp. CNPSo 3076]